MTLSHKVMCYYDIHTHQVPVHSGEVSIVNEIVRRGMDMRFPLTRDGVFFSYGIHPWFIEDVERQLATLKEVANYPEVVAIGEAGLDKLASIPIETQKDVFLSQACLAEEMGKPLIIHCVKAWEELIACRKMIRPQMPWILHGFRKRAELGTQLIQMGFYLSFGGHFQAEAVRAAWPDFLFPETDEEAIDIRVIYQRLAEALAIPVSDLITQISRNMAIFPIK